ncbi:MAG: ATP-binding protein, partial [Finegoldia magna]|nr:ATP-binding protein [Finegoldia magna]
MDLINRIKNTIIRENLIQENDKILVGLSGGADSVFLFNVLYEIKEELGFDIITCHINHSYRDTAVRDEEFSREISEEKNIKFFSKKVDMKQYSIENSISLEDSGR